jgi:hypothetical protein
MKIVVFTKDFATKKKGEEFKCSDQLASDLINVEKVAELKKEKKSTTKEDK